MPLASRAQLEAAARIVHNVFSGTPQYAWPLLAERAGCEVWVKHENHTPTGAFKIRGGLVFADDLARGGGSSRIVTATRGNHGQSVATACARFGIRSMVVVPHGNSAEKNAAMRAQGAELIVHGHDFQAAYEYARELAEAEGARMLASFHPLLVRGVASYALELFDAVADLDAVYVPIGLGSGICGVITARDVLGLRTKVIGVVAEQAPMYALSFAARKAVSTATADTMADGMACRVPDVEALEIILKGADEVITVSESEILAAMRHYYTDIHNIAEGAGAAPLAALLKVRERHRGQKVALILSGGNIDRELYWRVLADEETPSAETTSAGRHSSEHEPP